MRDSPWTNLPSVQPASCAWTMIITMSTEHVLVSCRATSDMRSRLFPELMNKVSQVQPMSSLLDKDVSACILTQFLIYCSSFNLPTSVCILYTTFLPQSSRRVEWNGAFDFILLLILVYSVRKIYPTSTSNSLTTSTSFVLSWRLHSPQPGRLMVICCKPGSRTPLVHGKLEGLCH